MPTIPTTQPPTRAPSPTHQATVPATATIPLIATTEPTPTNPYLPRLGPFPPAPIPVRPANLNPLTGLETDPALLRRRPLVVRIGNDLRVRTNFWQAGTSAADLVFEELIDQLGKQYINTRLTAIFLSKDPLLIGPIRSGRLINLQLTPMLDGAMVHAGASDGVRAIFAETSIINLDEYFNMPAYCYNQPHGYIGRLYTTAPRLREWLTMKHWEQPVSLYGFTFDETLPQGTPVETVGITQPPWPEWSAVEWRYDKATSVYARFVAGEQLIDHSYNVTANWGNGADCIESKPETRTPVTATNVVVLYTHHEPTQIVEDSNNALSVYIDLVGEGIADVFRDGVHLRGKWQRNSAQAFFTFVDDTGKIIPLKPGTTWFEIVPPGYALDF